MSHTIPFLWNYANRFTIFDNIFATEDTPSTPNAVAMIAGQSGETQWVKHGPGGTTGPIKGTINGQTFVGVDPNANGLATTQGVPLVNDPQPWWGSEFDATTSNRQPAGALGNSPLFVQSEFYDLNNIAPNLTFASVPLTLMGKSVKDITGHDRDSFHDLADIQNEPLAAFPIMAATGTSDAQWSAIVAWAINPLIRAETPKGEWLAGGIEALPIEAPELGLAKDWQKRVTNVAGSYGEMYRRNLGDGSIYRLSRTLNAPWHAGGLMLPPYLE